MLLLADGHIRQVVIWTADQWDTYSSSWMLDIFKCWRRQMSERQTRMLKVAWLNFRRDIRSGISARKASVGEQIYFPVAKMLTFCLTFARGNVRRLTKQPKLSAIIQPRRLTLFGHIMHMDDNADARRILLASPPADWRKQLGRPRITWLSTFQQDLKQHHLTLSEAADLAKNRPLWRMMSTYGAMQS